MNRDYEMIMKLNGEFDHAIVGLRDIHIREVQELRSLYFGALQEIKSLKKKVEELETRTEETN